MRGIVGGVRCPATLFLPNFRPSKMACSLHVNWNLSTNTISFRNLNKSVNDINDRLRGSGNFWSAPISRSTYAVAMSGGLMY